MIKNTARLSFHKTLPVMAGYIFLGITLGLVAKTSGLDWWIPVLMSTVIYSGALEFAAVPLLSAAFDPIGAFILGLTLSARHLFYGIPMLKKYESAGKIKPFLIFGLTDETFSLLSIAEIPENVQPGLFYFLVTLMDYLYWNIGTLLGALLGSILTINLEGLDFVLTALFVVLFLEQVRSKTGLISGLIGLTVTALSLILFGSSGFILASMIMMVIILMIGRKVIEND